MKKPSIQLIVCLLAAALSAYVNKPVQPSELEHDDSISEPVEADAQESEATLPMPVDAESKIEHGNSTSEPVEAETQEPDIAPPRATDVEGQIKQLKNGYFSNLTELSDYASECLKRIYPESETESDWLEWVECDLNDNGLKGLILQQKSSPPLKIKRIEAIFAIKDNEARLVDGAFGRQGTDLLFLAKNGNIINRYGYGGPESYERYAHYIYTDDWNQELVNDLTVIAYDWEVVERKNRENGLFDERVEKNPPWAIAGVCYYTKYRDEELDEPQFLKAYEEMTGYSFYGDNPMKPDWAD